MVSVQAPDVSAAWLATVDCLLREPRWEAIHTLTRITDPVGEVTEIRTAVDDLLESHQLQCVETVANTIFPDSIAASSRDHAELVERYRKMYPVLRKRYPQNNRGTYFGRLISYPTDKEPFDQVGAVIKRIGIERRSRGPRRARYEATVPTYEDFATHASIYVPGRDNSPMAFPCLSHCSFQLDGDRVHLLAHYRSQYLVERGYGNYLGLGRLLSYVAAQAELQVGHLTVVAGLAHLESPVMPLRKMVTQFNVHLVGQ